MRTCVLYTYLNGSVLGEVGVPGSPFGEPERMFCMQKILLVDDESAILDITSQALERCGYEILMASHVAGAIEHLEKGPVDLVITDLAMPGKSGFQLLETIRSRPGPYIPVIIVTGVMCDTTDMLRAFELGTDDYLLKPFSLEELSLRVQARLRMKAECGQGVARAAVGKTGRGRPPQARSDPAAEPSIPIRTPGMEDILARLQDVRGSDASVLFTGETGTGKSILARYLHDLSPRHGHPFVVANCSSLPPALLASELFGCEAGAFTGAGRERIGRLETAHRGTLFLDEIGDIGPEAQVSLLRFLAEKEFERLGSSRPIRVDVRVLAATNCKLSDAIEQNRFRRDLYYRLNVVGIEVPPLRDRPGDVALLARHFLTQIAAREGKAASTFSREALECLRTHGWPGNVRELANVIERAVLFSTGPTIGVEDISLEGNGGRPAQRPETSLDGSLLQVERGLIAQALSKTDGNRSQAARALGVPRTTLLTRMKRLGLKA